MKCQVTPGAPLGGTKTTATYNSLNNYFTSTYDIFNEFRLEIYFDIAYRIISDTYHRKVKKYFLMWS